MPPIGLATGRDAPVPTAPELESLAGGTPLLAVEGLDAGYGRMPVLHRFDLRVGRGQSLCLIGPNGAGKSTVLHSIYGLTDISRGRIVVGGADVTRLPANRKLKDAHVAYLLQDNSVFPDMSVEENLWLGGYLLARSDEARQRAEQVFARYEPLRRRRKQRAAVLSGGERR